MALILECENFPFNDRTKGVWYLLVNFQNCQEIDYWSVSDKIQLTTTLKGIIDNSQTSNFHLLGIWHGMYSTDIFKLNPTDAYRELSKYFNL